MKAKSGKLIEGVKPIEPIVAIEADEADPGKVAKTKAEQRKQKKGKYGETKAPPYKPIKDDESTGDEAEKPCSFVGIALLDENDKPIVGEKYEVDLPDGTMATGTLDANGTAKIEDIEPGECTVRFPNIPDECLSAK